MKPLKSTSRLFILLSILFISRNTFAQYVNVPVTGFTADVVADGAAGAATNSTTTSVDGANHSFVSTTFNPGSGICTAGADALPASNTISSNTTPGLTYTLQPYNANNALRLLPLDTGTVTVTAPLSASNLYLLVTSGDGASTFSAVITFTDLTTQTNTGTANDWCSGFSPAAGIFYRIMRPDTTCTGSDCQYMYDVAIPISAGNQSKLISSIFITNTGGGIHHLFAVGARVPPSVPPVFNMAGTAFQTANDCYQITDATITQLGSIFYKFQTSLNANFRIDAEMDFGNIQGVGGADGIAFVMEKSCSIVGQNGGGLGYQGISPSVVVEFDDFQNSTGLTAFSDPYNCHVGLVTNGNPDHAAVTARALYDLGSYNYLTTNNPHPVSFIWNGTLKSLVVVLDGINVVNWTEDFANTIFGGESWIYWGFTASTGDSYNQQSVCITQYPDVNSSQLRDTVVCNGVGVAVQTNNNMNSYSWSPNNGTISDSAIYNPVLTPTVTTTYTVTMTDTCGGVITDDILVTVTSIPAPTILQGGDTLFTGQGYASYQWYFGSSVIPGATNYYYIAPQSGNYNIIVTDTNGCSVGAGIINVIAGVFGAGSLQPGVSVYPNPARDEITIYLPTGQAGGLPFRVCDIEIYNSIGQVVYSATVDGKQIRVNCKAFAEGIYLLTIQTKEEKISRKFVIEK